MSTRGSKNLGLLLMPTRGMCGEDQKMWLKGLIAQGIYTIRRGGRASLSIAPPVLKCLAVMAVGLAVTSCSVTVAEWTLFGGVSKAPDRAATSVYSSRTPNMAYQPLPTPPQPAESSAIGSRAASYPASPKPAGLPSAIPKPVCPKVIPGPQPIGRWQ